MSRFIHISQFDPLTSRGGVAQFGVGLKLVVPDLVCLCHSVIRDPWEHTERINQEFLKNGTISKEDTVIADGYYADGLYGKVDRLIVVCHSTYAGWLRDSLTKPASNYPTSWLTKAAMAQEEAYQRADEIVAVSHSAAQEIEDFYQRDPAVIFNGVDTDRLVPVEDLPESIVEVAGKDINKGADMVAEVAAKGDFKIHNLGYGGSKAERWAQHGIAFLPSRHEGGPYAQLEAMAMNLKVVTSDTGYARSVVHNTNIWHVYDYHWAAFARELTDAMYSDRRNPREWVLANATLDWFIKNWREFLGVKDEN